MWIQVEALPRCLFSNDKDIQNQETQKTSRDIKRHRCQFSSTCQFRLDLARFVDLMISHQVQGTRNPSGIQGIEQSSTIPWILPMLELWVLRWNHYRTSQVMISRICISFIFIVCIYVAKMYLVLSGCFVKKQKCNKGILSGRFLHTDTERV